MRGHYNGNSADSRLTKVRLAKVRFLIGDTDKEKSYLSNEEIESFLNEEKSDAMAAAKAGVVLVAKLMALNEYEKADQLRKTCEELRDRAQRSASPGGI
jgi:ATP/maltotriose-dependent transcriptional regulator MalT